MHHEIKALIDEFKPGFAVGPTTSTGKVAVLGPDGDFARLPSGQKVTLPMTPRVNGHYLKQTRGNLVRAGVIERGQLGGGTGGGGAKRMGGGRQRYGAPRGRVLPHRRKDDQALRQQLRQTAIDLLREGHDPRQLIELLAQACRQVDKEREKESNDAQSKKAS